MVQPDAIRVRDAAGARPGLESQPVDDELLFFVGEEPGSFGTVRQDLPDDKGQEHWHDAFDDEDPVPAVQAGQSGDESAMTGNQRGIMAAT